jgi:hypothetical protein
VDWENFAAAKHRLQVRKPGMTAANYLLCQQLAGLVHRNKVG